MPMIRPSSDLLVLSYAAHEYSSAAMICHAYFSDFLLAYNRYTKKTANKDIVKSPLRQTIYGSCKIQSYLFFLRNKLQL